MNNGQYLVLSYFAVAVICVLLALTTYALLRRSFADLSRTISGGKLGTIYRRLFFPVLVLASMAGFLSVTFQSCSKHTYAEIIADRSYLVAKNQEQLRSSMSYICIALLIWGLVVMVGLIASDKKTR